MPRASVMDCMETENMVNQSHRTRGFSMCQHKPRVAVSYHAECSAMTVHMIHKYSLFCINGNCLT
jgi:hypothetical protein